MANTNKETEAVVEKEVKTQAALEEEAKKLTFITTDGKDHKQGDKVVKKAFGVTIVTNY
jgi:hypothetical protein